MGYLIWGRQVVEIEEKPAPPVWHDDWSLTAIRDPKANPDLPAPSVPEGGRLVRTIELTVRPINVHKSPINGQISKTQDTSSGEIAPADCPPVSVRLDMTQHDDGLRVSMRAEGGEILDAVDIPQTSIYIPRNTKHVVSIGKVGDTYSARYGRTFGALDVGLAADIPEGERPAYGGWIAYRF
jgi:hypothetical protein